MHCMKLYNGTNSSLLYANKRILVQLLSETREMRVRKWKSPPDTPVSSDNVLVCREREREEYPHRCYRGGRDRAARKLLVRWWPPRGVAFSGKCKLNRSLCAPRVLRESGGAFRAAGRRPICTREAGTRFRHFLARHRTFPCSVRCLRGTCRRRPLSYP